MKISPALIKNAIIARGNATNRLFDLSVTLSDETIAYLNVENDTVRATTKKDGTWTDLYTLVTKSDLNSALIHRGDITGDLNRASTGGITSGYYTVGSPSTISNGPKGISWCIFIQFYGNFHTQMIIDTTGLFVRKFVGNPAKWSDWAQYSKS